MANSPKKSKDPTELALSAIEDALSVRDTPRESPQETPPVQRREPAVNAPVEREEPSRRTRSTPQLDATERRRFDRAPVDPVLEEAPIGRKAANDDRESVGNILRALQRRPSKTPVIVAWAFTACWTIFFLGLVFGTYAADIGELMSQGTSSVPIVIGLIGAFCAPIVLFFFLATMLSRAQELRLVGQSMAEIALRLAEPETVARDAVVSVGQAVRREVAAIGDGVERALARASELEGLVNNEVAALERAYADNEARMRGLIDGIVTQRETLIGHAEQVRAAISNVHIDLSHEIGAVSDMVADQVNDAARKITGSLEEKGEHITRALQQSGDNMIAALGDRGGDLLERLEQTSDMTTRAIDAASERMATSLNFKTSNINDEFAEITENIHHMLSGRLDRIADEFSAKAVGVVDNMDERARGITDAMVDTSTSLAESIAARVDEVNNTLKSTGDSLVLDLSLRGGDVVAKLEQTGTAITDAIAGSGSRVAETFQQNAEALTSTVASHGDIIRDMIAQRLAAFEEMFTHGGTELGERIARDTTELGERIAQATSVLGERISQDTSTLGERITRDASTLGDLVIRQLSEFDNTVRVYGGELVERIGQRTHEIDQTMRDYVEGFDGRVTAKVSDVTTALDERLGRFQEALDDRTKSINDGLSNRVMEIAKSVAGGGREIVAALDQRVEEVSKAMADRAAEVADTLTAKSDELDRMLGTQATQVAANFDQRLDRFEAMLTGRAEDVISELESRGLATANRLTATMQDITSSVSQAEQAIGSLATNTGGALRTAAGEVERAIASTASQTEQSLTTMSSGIANSIRQAASDAERTIHGSTSQVEQAVTSLSNNLSSTLKMAAAEVERTMTNVSSQVANDFIGKADAIAGSIGKRSGELTRILDDKSGSLVAAISLKTSEMTNELTRVAELTSSTIDNKGAAFARGLRETSQEITRTINDASERAAGNVTKAMKDLEESNLSASERAAGTVTKAMKELEDSNAGAIERSKNIASVAVAEMLETHGMLRSDTTVLFERLREANALLQEVLAGANTNLGSIEHVLSTRVADFVSTMNNLLEKTGATTTRMDEHIGGFYEVTGKVLENLGDLAARFNMHGSELADAATLLSASNKETESAVADRRGMLENLVTTLDARASDLDTRLKRFNSLLDESLSAAEGRARDIARTIADSSNAGTHIIAEQFQAVRDSAEAEQRRTLDAMRQVYEHATGDAQSMFQGAAERFSEIVQGMKHMAGDMQRELESTRQELRRGILELPQETAESAAQMRRVIVDQIEALAELNRIVARHGREVEVAEPVRRVPQREEAVAAVSNVRTEAPAPRNAYVGNAPPVAPAPTARQSDAQPSAPQSGQAATAGQANWLSDLLSRASRDGDVQPQRGEARGPRNEERPTRHSIESLDSLSLDIARMIDHDAAAELWDRYNRGERNVFTRKLYTMQGQKAFEEVRRRYRSDREFKQTVDRYIAEFERLLEEVSRDDRGQVVARTYLTSETGKVYTMLAHAAGRIE